MATAPDNAGRVHIGKGSAQQHFRFCSPKMRTVFLALSESLSHRGSISAFIIEVSGEMDLAVVWGKGMELF